MALWVPFHMPGDSGLEGPLNKWTVNDVTGIHPRADALKQPLYSELVAPYIYAMLLYPMPLPSQEMRCPDSEMWVFPCQWPVRGTTAELGSSGSKAAAQIWMLLWFKAEGKWELGLSDRMKLSLVIRGVGAWWGRKDDDFLICLDWGPFQNYWSKFLEHAREAEMQKRSIHTPPLERSKVEKTYNSPESIAYDV